MRQSTNEPSNARLERLRAALPSIEAKYLHTDFVDTATQDRSRVGPGKEPLLQAVEEFAVGHWESARNLFNEAISLGLTMPFESVAHSGLGTIHIKLGDFPTAIEQYLKCLEVPVRDKEALRNSVNVLWLLYTLARRENDAESLRVLAQNTYGKITKLTPDFERQLLDVTKAFMQ